MIFYINAWDWSMSILCHGSSIVIDILYTLKFNYMLSSFCAGHISYKTHDWQEFNKIVLITNYLNSFKIQL